MRASRRGQHRAAGHTNRSVGEGVLRAGACLAQAKDVALLELPRDQPRTTHTQLEEDVASAAREVRAADAIVPRVVVHHRVEPKAAVVPLVADVSAPTRKLRGRGRSRVSGGVNGNKAAPPPPTPPGSCVEEREGRTSQEGRGEGAASVPTDLPVTNDDGCRGRGRGLLLRLFLRCVSWLRIECGPCLVDGVLRLGDPLRTRTVRLIRLHAHAHPATLTAHRSEVELLALFSFWRLVCRARAVLAAQHLPAVLWRRRTFSTPKTLVPQRRVFATSAAAPSHGQPRLRPAAIAGPGWARFSACRMRSARSPT